MPIPFYIFVCFIEIAPKKKGVISQSVKEVTQSLVDDGLVECEKIGTFVCYWAFPSKALQTVNRFPGSHRLLSTLKHWTSNFFYLEKTKDGGLGTFDSWY